MTLYHGSTAAIENPKILDIQRFLDFGNGFYTTSIQMQAERWAITKQKRANDGSKAIVSVYELNQKWLEDDYLKIKSFYKANEEWLDFVVGNRKNTTYHLYDVIRGAVANDALYQTLALYETNILTKQETIVRLKSHLLFDQISFHTAKALNKLKFSKCYEISSQ
jgi:hypothetical protein